MACQIDSDVDTGGVDHQLFGQHQTQVKVADGQTHGRLIDAVELVNAAIGLTVRASVVVEIAVATHRHANEAIGIIDANRQRGDDGFCAIAQRDMLAAFFGQRHRGRQLQETRQVDFGITDLGLDDFFREVQEHPVVATRGHHEAGRVDLAVLVAVFAEVKNAVAIGILIGVKNQVVVQVLAQEQHAVAIGVFGEVLEGRAFLVIDGRRAKQLDRRIHHWPRLRNHKGVDVDFNIFGAHFQNAGGHTHQRGRFDARLGRNELGRELIQTRNRLSQARCHDGQTKVNIGDFHTHRAGVDAVQNFVAVQVVAIAVGPAHTGKTGQVGATQREGVDPQGEGVKRHSRGVADLRQGRSQTTGIHRHGEFFTLTEGQRATQEQEVGHRNLGQTNVKAKHFIAIQLQQHRCAAGFDQQALRQKHTIVIAVLDALVVRHGTHQRLGSTWQLECGAAAGVDVHRDVPAQDFEHIAQAIHTHFISMGGEREHALGLHELGQVGLERANGQVQVLQTKAHQVLLRQWCGKVRATRADEHIDVAGT